MKKIIAKVLAGKGFSVFLLFVLVCCSSVLYGQSKPVNGVVVDQENNSPVPHATIRVKGSQTHATANSIGRF